MILIVLVLPSSDVGISADFGTATPATGVTRTIVNDFLNLCFHESISERKRQEVVVGESGSETVDIICCTSSTSDEGIVVFERVNTEPFMCDKILERFVLVNSGETSTSISFEDSVSITGKVVESNTNVVMVSINGGINNNVQDVAKRSDLLLHHCWSCGPIFGVTVLICNQYYDLVEFGTFGVQVNTINDLRDVFHTLRHGVISVLPVSFYVPCSNTVIR
mmetsp:Transcript_10398/g.25142  ORF Transcript_10398/g.25142 Transcript_10398/m.25142 type:complete len:221 (+) Transcript_10398:757-1419(+)